MIKKLYPDGKSKAFNITYDDGVLQDIRFVELLNKYNIKGTFNLNSQLMEQQFSWTHQNGMQVTRLPKETVVELYKGHEVASHTLTHPYMDSMVYGEIMRQLGQDKRNLQQLFGREICGFALPFDHYSPLIAQCAKTAVLNIPVCHSAVFPMLRQQITTGGSAVFSILMKNSTALWKTFLPPKRNLHSVR